MFQNRAIRQDAIIIENVGSSCADTLKHIKNLYDQTRYLKGVINMVSRTSYLTMLMKYTFNIIYIGYFTSCYSKKWYVYILD